MRSRLLERIGNTRCMVRKGLMERENAPLMVTQRSFLKKKMKKKKQISWEVWTTNWKTSKALDQFYLIKGGFGFAQLKKLPPLYQPNRSWNQNQSWPASMISRALRQLHVFASRFYWFTGFPVPCCLWLARFGFHFAPSPVPFHACFFYLA